MCVGVSEEVASELTFVFFKCCLCVISGLGKQLALVYARQHCNVVLADLREDLVQQAGMLLLLLLICNIFKIAVTVVFYCR